MESGTFTWWWLEFAIPPFTDNQRQNLSKMDGQDLNEYDGERSVDSREESDESGGDKNQSSNDGEPDDAEATPVVVSKPRKVHRLSLKKTEDFNEKLKNRGVIYVARVPPRMTPTKLKSLLSDFGEVTRVYLVEEDAAVRKRRRKLSGNGSKRYVEGWVEFASKKIAKSAAASLNATPISNHKRNPHCDDLWMLKYLSKFQWSHLTEKVAYERRVKEQKLRLETMQAKRETAAYKYLVETGKKLDKIEERKRKRAEREGTTTLYDDSKKKKNRPAYQVKPVMDGGDKPGIRAILGALV
jgi:ESF2/ABP1 family protein